MAILPVGIAGGVLRVYVVPAGARPCCRRHFWKTSVATSICVVAICLFFVKFGVRAVVTSKQSSHLLLSLTSFGPQGHKIPTEIQPRTIADESVIYRAICDRSKQNQKPLRIASTSDRMPSETDNIGTDTHHSTDKQEQDLCDEPRE